MAADGDVGFVVALIIHTFRSSSTSELLRGGDDCLNLTLLLSFHAFVYISSTLRVSLCTVHFRRTKLTLA